MIDKKNVFQIIDGWIDVICGPMFSGKSTELINRVNRLSFAKVNYLIFKPIIDSRNGTMINSRNGTNLQAIEINNAEEIYDHIKNSNSLPYVVAIDEIHLLDNRIVDVVQALSNCGINSILSGLDRDFRGEYFTQTANLLAIADHVTKLTAICTKCGSDATRTQRIINTNPASYNSDLILIGGKECYTARCRLHHIVPNKPINKIDEKFNALINQLKNSIKKSTSE